MKRFVERMLGRADEKPPGKTDEKSAADFFQPSAPSGRRIYSIGDIHGRLDLLQELHEMIARDSAGFEVEKAVVYLGDYIDRGAQSRQVLELLIEQPLTGFETVCLMGNHERAMLDFIEHPQSAIAWLSFGGQETLLSYGVGLGRPLMTQDPEVLRYELEENVPQDHLAFMSSCHLSHVEGDYCFVHAGIRPGVALENQSPDDLIWIRDEFTRSRASHEHVVVHGHSISTEVEWRPNRIGIDTGAYQSGLLTALVLEGTEQRLLQTGRAEGEM